VAVDWLITEFAKLTVLVAVAAVELAVCILVCGLALTPLLAALYLFVEWYEKRRSSSSNKSS